MRIRQIGYGGMFGGGVGGPNIQSCSLMNIGGLGILGKVFFCGGGLKPGEHPPPEPRLYTVRPRLSEQLGAH